MLSDETMSLVTPETADSYAAALTRQDIPLLVDRLDSKEDRIRYPAFLLLRARSALCADVYPYWDTLTEKLTSANSYQRSIGAMLLAANARWDTQDRMRACLNPFLALLNDEKPITVRQCAQALCEIIAAKPALAGEICAALTAFDLMRIKETMRKLVLADFLEALFLIRSAARVPEAEAYIFSALSGNILDEPLKKKFRARL